MEQGLHTDPGVEDPSGSAFLENLENGCLELSEYATTELDRDALPDAAGLEIWRSYQKYISVEFPSPRSAGRWRFTSQGAVGFLPVSQELSVTLTPKVELGSIFRMLEYAYDLNLQTYPGLLDCQSVNEFFARIANILAQRVVDRARRGLYRSYVSHEDELPYVRGSINLRRAVVRPWNVRLDCRFEEHTADIEDNCLLAWTLHEVARTGDVLGAVRSNVHAAYRIMRSATTTTPFRSSDCAGRLYTRLNDDYEPMHALCRFLLDTVGPTHERGDRSMLPFVIDMAALFERFVFSWMKAHLPSRFTLTSQETVWSSNQGTQRFEADLVLRDAETGRVLSVLDTKYKAHEGASASDIQQVVAYATALGCRDAYLIYPKELAMPLEESVGDITVRSTTFSLAGDLEVAGRKLLAQLGLYVPAAGSSVELS